MNPASLQGQKLKKSLRLNCFFNIYKKLREPRPLVFCFFSQRWNFWKAFLLKVLLVNSSLLRLEFLSRFLPSFSPSTRWHSRKDLSTGVPGKYVLRQVDDVPVAAPADSGLCEKFSQTYKEMCADLNVQLAPDCPLQDKAFTNQKIGKVLGVMFDTCDMSWRLSDFKIENAKMCCLVYHISCGQCIFQHCPYIT
jgi:hypothetical protein